MFLPLFGPPLLQIDQLGLTVVCKERSKRTSCPLVVMGAPMSSARGGGVLSTIAVAVEPFTMYIKVRVTCIMVQPVADVYNNFRIHNLSPTRCFNRMSPSSQRNSFPFSR